MSTITDRTISIELAVGTVPVYIRERLDFDSFAALCLQQPLPDRVGIVSDTTVFSLYGDRLEDALQKTGLPVSTVVLPPGESTKSLAVGEEVFGLLSEAGFSRRSLLIALGGGVIGDLAGFVAGTYMRGIDYVQVPTSLLAQVDSAIGGKVAVNHWSAKNLVGLFYHPRCIWACPEFLSTLPAEEFGNAFGEILKYALTLDEALFEILQDVSDVSVVARDPAHLNEIIGCCMTAKAEVVTQDEREGGLRKVLNFGHSIGHALESASGYRLMRHGEAVAWGMIMAQRLGRELKIVPAEWAERSEAFVRRLMSLPDLSPLRTADLRSYLVRDKKNVRGQLFFVFSTGPGRYTFQPDIDIEAVQRIFQQCVGESA